jgi:hypothetical protein
MREGENETNVPGTRQNVRHGDPSCGMECGIHTVDDAPDVR